MFDMSSISGYILKICFRKLVPDVGALLTNGSGSGYIQFGIPQISSQEEEGLANSCSVKLGLSFLDLMEGNTTVLCAFNL